MGFTGKKALAFRISGIMTDEECESSKHSGIRTRNICGFLLPGHPAMAGRATDTRPENGKEVHRLCTAFNLPATLRGRVKAVPQVS
jgi:hypothetical protein